MKLDFLPTPLELRESLDPSGLGERIMTYLSTDPLPRGIIESLNIILLGYIERSEPSENSKTSFVDHFPGFRD